MQIQPSVTSLNIIQYIVKVNTPVIPDMNTTVIIESTYD